MTENTAAAAKSAAKSALRTCRCGCGAPLGGKAAYRPGHDARHVSNLKRALEAVDAHSETAQAEVYAIFTELKSTALRQKLGRAVDNDKEGLYNGFGDAGVFVPYSENPSLGGDNSQGQDQFEAAHPAEAPKGKKAKGAPAVADEPWITHEPTQTEGSKRVGEWLDGSIEAFQDALKDIHGKTAAPAEEPMWDEETAEWDENTKWVHEDVKVGRWTYPARQYEDGLIVRNTKRDGSGEWVRFN